MGIKDTVENHPVVWTLATAIAAFVAGFGAYEAILKISQNRIVSVDAHVLSSDEKAMPREEYNKLLARISHGVRIMWVPLCYKFSVTSHLQAQKETRI